MRKRRIAAILSCFVLVAGGIFAAILFSGGQNPKSVQAGGPEGRFDFNRPPTFIPGGGGYEVLGSRHGEPQIFSLQTRFFNPNDNSDITQPADSLGVPHPDRPMHPVFSDIDMQRILRRQVDLSYNQSDPNAINTIDYGFVMLDDLNPSAANNRVVFELTNLRSRDTTIQATSFSFTDPQGNRTVHMHGGGTEPGTMPFFDRDWMFTQSGDPNQDIRNWASQNVGQIAFNNQYSYVGHFFAEGYYRFMFTVTSSGFSLYPTNLVIEFAFYIVHKSNYLETPNVNTVADDGIPTYNAPVTRRGTTNQYFFNFGGIFPYARWNPTRFLVEPIEAVGFQQAPIQAPPVITDPDANHLLRTTFTMIGGYTVRSRMIFTFRGEQVAARNWSGYVWNLTIFGYQAYWEKFTEVDGRFISEPAWFGGQEEGGRITNADISGLPGGFNLPNTAIPTTPTGTVSQAAAQARINAVRDFQRELEEWAEGHRARPPSDPNRFTPVVTNSPPVQLFGNALLSQQSMVVDGVTRNIHLSTMSFNNGRDGWVRVDDFLPTRPILTAGEYIITIYYDFPMANNWERDHPYRQIFYFRIVDLLDVRVAHYDNGVLLDIFHLNDYVDRVIPISGSFLVFMDGMDGSTEMSPYANTPRITLEVTNFNGVRQAFFPAFALDDLLTQRETYDRYREGIYIFRVFYGNIQTASAEFRIIVDNSKVDTFVTQSNGTRYVPDGPIVPNFSIWGAGQTENFQVVLEWAPKLSGVSFRHAAIEFYAFQNIGPEFRQHDRVRDENMVSPYRMSNSRMNYNLRIVDFVNEDGEARYRIEQPFTASGMYIIRILDFAGNESIYVLVIDNTRAAFSQDPILEDYNMVNMATDPAGAWIGFGRNKVIGIEPSAGTFLETVLDFHLDYDDQFTMYEMLGQTNIFAHGMGLGTDDVLGGVRGFSIPMERAQISLELSEHSFQTVFTRGGNGAHLQVVGEGDGIFVGPTVNRHYVFLQRENFYIFRSFDVFGNVSYFYVFVNFDMSRGVVLEDDVPDLNLGTGVGGEVWSQSASIVRPNGMANRDFITFSFIQRAFTQSLVYPAQYVVDRVYVSFYAKTYERYYWEQVITNEGEENEEIELVRHRNPNFPFAPQSTSTSLIYERPLSNDAEHFVYLDINHNPVTQEGIYIITRHFVPSTVPPARRWDVVRNYFFIVDRNPIVAPIGVFESDIRLQMGQKIATYDDFQKERNHTMNPDFDLVLQTNSNVRVQLPHFGTKYDWRENVNGLYQFFGGYTMNVGFTRTHLVNPITGEYVYLDETSHPFRALRLNIQVEFTPAATGVTETLGLTANNINQAQFTNDGLYRLRFSDGSGGMRWQLYGFGSQRTELRNQSEILFEIVGGGNQGSFFRNGNRIVTGANNNFSTQFDEDDRITFSYIHSDTRTFFADISSSGLSRNGTPFSTSVASPWVSEHMQGTARIIEYDLTAIGALNDDTFAVTLTTLDHAVSPNPTNFVLTIDNTSPYFNLGLIREGDHLWRTHDTFRPLHMTEEAFAENFVFSLSNTFEFRLRPGLNPQHDTAQISFFEVSPNLTTIQGEQGFEYNDGPFANIVELGPEQNRFFRIVERDEAGNLTQYHVQLRGDRFNDHIETRGLTPDELGRDRYGNNLFFEYGNDIGIFGIDIAVVDVSDFWMANPQFELRFGNEVFRRMGNWAILGQGHGQILANTIEWMDARPIHLQDRLNIWLTQNNHGENPVVLEFNNGYLPRIQRIFNIRHETPPPNLAVAPTGIASGVMVSVTNWPAGTSAALPAIYRSFQLMRITAVRIDTGEPIEVMPFFNGSWTIPNAETSELLITLRDEFNRVVRIEHNGQHGNHADFRWNGVPRQARGMWFTGHEDGVDIEFTLAVHTVQIIHDGRLVFATNTQGHVTVNTAIAEDDISDHETLTGVTVLRIRPPLDSMQSRWQVVITSIASNNLRLGQEFSFYTNLPELVFTNLNGDCIAGLIEEGEVRGIVQVSFSYSSLLFGASVHYSRTVLNPDFNPEMVEWEGNPRTITEFHTVRRGATRFTLDMPGVITVEVVNEVSARHSITFEITDVDNIVYKVFFTPDVTPGMTDEEREEAALNRTELRPSPVPFPFTLPGTTQVRNIPSYFFVGTNQNASTLRYGLEIEPSLNYPRTIVGVDVPVASIPNAGGNATHIYALESELTGSRLFLAVTAIAEGPIASTAISMNSNQWTEDTPNLYRLFRQLPNNGLDVSLQINAPNRFNIHQGNVYYIDYYYNGNWAGRLFDGDVLTILERDYGVFTFYIRDWAGNQRHFSNNSPQNNQVVGEAEHYTIIILTRPPVLVNGHEIIDGMAYNDEITIDVIPIPFSPNNMNFMFISEIVVERNGIQHPADQFTAASKSYERASFTFTEPGFYRFRITYLYHQVAPGNMAGAEIVEFSAHLLSTFSGQESFVFSGSSNMEVVSIMRGGIDLRRNMADDHLTGLELNTNTGLGTHVVTVRIAADNIREEYTKTFTVIIAPFTRTQLVWSSVEFGQSTTNAVAITWNPFEIFWRFGNATLTITHDGQPVGDPIRITAQAENDWEDRMFEDDGMYLVILTQDATGAVIFSDGFEIYTGIGVLAVVFIIIISAVVVVAIALFFFLRHRMKVK